MNAPKTAPLWLAALAIAPIFLSIVNEVPEVDPAQYADVSARMVRTGDWMAPRDTYGPHINKPPLMFWAQASAMTVFGVGSFAARLPAVLLALVALFGVYLVGRQLRDRRLGVVAALLFAAQVATHHMVLDPKVDMALTATTTLAVWAVLAARSRPRLIWVAWAFAGLAVLSKGPLGLGLVVLALAPEALRSDFNPGSAVRRVLALRPVGGAIIVAAIAAPFYVATAKANGSGATWHLLWTQGFGRLFGQSEWVGNTTPLFFLHTGLWAFLPSSVFVVFGLARRARAFWKERSLPPSVERVPLWWLLLPLAVLSVPSYKLPQHIYCLAPAAALLGAQELLALGEAAHRRWRLVFSIGAAGTALVGAGILVAIFSASALATAGWLVLLFGVPAAAALYARRLDTAEGTALWAAGAMAGFLLLLHGAIQPLLLEYQPGREIGARVRREDPDGKLLAYFGVSVSSGASFYANRDCTWVEAVDFPARIRAGDFTHAIVGDATLEQLKQNGVTYTVLEHFVGFNTSIPTRAFLDPATRPQQLEGQNLVRVSVPPGPKS